MNDWQPDLQELHAAWRAFVELHKLGEIEVDIRESEQSKAVQAGWPLAEHRILQRMLASAQDFHTACDSFGVDVLDSATGLPIRPYELQEQLTDLKLRQGAS